MTARLTFLGITAFWVAMNVLLWQAEFGARGGDIPVPLNLVWRKILTAPDSSSLSVYQNKDRTGYCEFTTSVGQQMATMDEDKPPPESFNRSGYQLHVAGNVAFGDFTNRLKFDGRMQFSPARKWQELNFRISSRSAVVEIHSLASNQTVHIQISSDGAVLEKDLTFDELQNPDTLVRAFAGDFYDALLGGEDLPGLPADSLGQKIQWEARRTRIKIGTESVPVYRLETAILDHPITVDVSTLGEILCIKLPDNVTAVIDELNRP